MTDHFPWLTAIVLLPLVASLLVPVLPDKTGKIVRWYALGVALADFALMCYAFWTNYEVGTASFQMTEQYAWVPQIGLNWTLSVDGVSMPLVQIS